MKKLFILLTLISLALTSCTDNQRARMYGGTETVNLPAGERLVVATWKEAQIWYLTEQMPADYKPQQKIFREKSGYGLVEGTVIFVETR